MKNSVRCIVFAGAGASMAVDASFLTTAQFFDRLPKDISNDLLFVGLSQFVRSRFSSSSIDIEQWLWTAKEARDALAALSNQNSPVGWLLGENRLVQMLGQGSDFRAAIGTTEAAVRRLISLDDRICRLVYQIYKRRPTEEMLRRTWIPLLGGLLNHGMFVDVFTTNYDVVLEEAVAIGGFSVETGRIRGTYSEIEEETWKVAREEDGRGRGLLTKLHGSVDWIRIDDRIHFGTPKFQGVHEDHVIIYPGFKGRPTRQPFLSFHEYFVRAVERVDIAVFVGFAFRDEYINQVLKEKLRKRAAVVLINPSLDIDSLPFEKDRILYIDRPFDDESSMIALESIPKLFPGNWQA